MKNTTKTRGEAASDRFIRLPVSLLGGELSTEAAVLYALLRERLSLSRRNGWADENGEAFVLCGNEEICALLGCGHDKATRLLRELEGAGLLRRVRQRRGWTSRLYPLPLAEKTTRKGGAKNAEKPRSSLRKTGAPDGGKPAASKKEKSHTEKSEKEKDLISSLREKEDLTERIKAQIGFDALSRKHGRTLTEEVVRLMADALRGTGATVHLGGSDLPRAVVRERLLGLRERHVDHVLQALAEHGDEIRNFSAYLLAALYNAPVAVALAESKKSAHARSLEEYMRW